ncbi:MAG: carbohydrate kinase family protein [Candidatus Margulisiibacteriota bacterium]
MGRTVLGLGHICYDFSATAGKALSAHQARATQNCVAGINGLSRGELRLSGWLRENHGLSINDVSEKNGWGPVSRLPGSIGGPGASSFRAAFQTLLPDRGQVRFYGAIGNDDIGSVLAAEYRRYNMDPSTLLKLSGVPTSYTLVINEKFENGSGGAAESRTFLHEPGANSIVGVPHFPESVFTEPWARDGVFAVGGNFLMQGLHPDGVISLMASAKRHGLTTVLNTVHHDESDPFKQWKLGNDPARVIDLLVMDREEAAGISGVGPMDGVDSLAHVTECVSALMSQGFRNLVVTDGAEGSYWYIGNDLVFPKSGYTGRLFYVPSSEYIREQGVVSGLGAGDVFAGGILSSIAERRSPLEAAAYATAAAGLCVRNLAGEIGGPVKQGGYNELVQEVAILLLAQMSR